MTTQEQQALVDAAIAARKQAYAPYSKFHVGAALQTASGKVFIGCNVENASYGMTICAERTAIFSAVAAGERDFAAIAIASSGGHAPCGGCRQVMAEFNADMPVLLVDSDQPTKVVETSMATLLPGRFIFPESSED